MSITPLMPVYPRCGFRPVRGEHCHLIGEDGQRYLDFAAGIAVNLLGHSHQGLIGAIQKQAETLMHVSNLYGSPQGEHLAQRLVDLTFADTVFFTNSGAEAVECAIKTVRAYHQHAGDEHRYEIITFKNAFHGRTMATISASNQEKMHKGFMPLLQGFKYVDFDDLEGAKAAIGPNTAGFLVEPVQGEGGINPMRVEYLKQVRALCDEKDWLLMIDEVQCGMGRTGKWFAHQWAGIKPDVMPLAKGLGSGVPIGAVVAGPKAAHIFGPGNHGTTFGGNPLAMRAGVETLRIMEEEGLLQNAAEVGAHLKAALEKALAGNPGVKEVRGQGLMLGIELAKPCGVLAERALHAGLLLSVTADSVIRLVPPLILTRAEADEMVAILVPLIEAFLKE